MILNTLIALYEVNSTFQSRNLSLPHELSCVTAVNMGKGNDFRGSIAKLHTKDMGYEKIYAQQCLPVALIKDMSIFFDMSCI